MIETIYKTEDYENRKPDINIRLPKNIKQIGQNDINMNSQIYIEENVLTFIKQSPQNDKQIRYGVLLGDKKHGNGYTYIFINGMVEVEEVIEAAIIFSDDVWTRIYDNIKRYYKEGNVVGWYASFNHDMTKDMQGIRKIHLDHFAGNHKVFLNINREDDDEAFFLYERNGMVKQPCYHVYFEKSDDFEDYLFGSGKSEDITEAKGQRTPEKGKYGIVLNSDSNKKDTVSRKLSARGIGRVASFAAIIALTGVLVGMGKNGQLNVLRDKVKGLVDGILDTDDGAINTGNIISVDGTPKDEETTEANGEEANASDNSKESSSGEVTSDNEGSTLNEQENTLEDKENTLEDKENTSQDETTTSNDETDTSEEETTEDSHVTISDPSGDYVTYIVEDGDTLYSIVMEMYGNIDKIEEIVELNSLEDENYVMEGQKIFLP